MISVARNAHMPRVEASCCCARSSNWWATIERPCGSNAAACPTSVPLRYGSKATCDRAGLGLTSAGTSSPAGRPVDDSGAGKFELLVRVVVGLFGHDRCLGEILGR